MALPATRKYQEIPFDVHKFSGINIREDQTIISDTELMNCVNYDLGRTGELKKRTGFLSLGSSNILTPQEASFEGAGVGGWLSDYNTPTIAVSAVTANNGVNSLAMTATVANQMAIRINKPVVVGSTYTGMFDIKAGSVGRGFVGRFVFRNAANADVGNFSTAMVTNSTTTWTTHLLVAVAPATAVTVDFYVWCNYNNAGTSPVIGEVHYIDKAAFMLGNKAASAWTATSVVFANNTQVKIIGFFQTDVYAQFIAQVGTFLYTSSDGVTWTNIFSLVTGVDWGVQFNNKYYMVRGSGTILKWDGVTCVAIAGSPHGTHCCVFKSRLFVVDSGAAGALSSRLTYSETFDLAADFATWPATNYTDFQPGDGDFLVSIYSIKNALMVFKTNSTWVLHATGVPTAWPGVRLHNNSIGCISRHSMCESEGTLIFQGIGGVYETDGSTTKLISNPILPAFSGVAAGQGNVNKSSAFFWEDKYVLMIESYAVSNTWALFQTQPWSSLQALTWGSINTVYDYYVYHTKVKGWTKWTPIGINPAIFITVDSNTTLRGVYCSDRNPIGNVYKYGDKRYTDNAEKYECLIETKDTDFGSPIRLKRGKWMALKQRGVGTHTVTQIADGIPQISTSITAIDTVKIEYKMVGPGFLRSWRIRTSAITENSLIVLGFTMRLNIMFSRIYGETSI